MKKLTAGIFTVLLSLGVGADANADIASQAYVDRVVSALTDRVDYVSANLELFNENFDATVDTRINVNLDMPDSPLGELSANVRDLQDAVGDDTSGLVKEVNELKAAVGDGAEKYTAGENIQISSDNVISATLPIAGEQPGAVRGGGDITVSSNGDVTVNNAATATNAKKICNGAACTSFVDIWVE